MVENSLDSKLVGHLTSESSLDLSNVPFFKMIYSMILEVQETIWQAKKQAVGKGTHTMALELTRVFKSLSQSGEKNIFNQKIIQSKLKETLLRIESCSEHEMEAIMSIVNESAPNQIHYGSVCANQANQVFTVIGFFEKPYNETKLKPNEQLDSFSPEFDPSSPKKYIYGLYYDANSPER